MYLRKITMALLLFMTIVKDDATFGAHGLEYHKYPKCSRPVASDCDSDCAFMAYVEVTQRANPLTRRCLHLAPGGNGVVQRLR